MCNISTDSLYYCGQSSSEDVAGIKNLKPQGVFACSRATRRSVTRSRCLSLRGNTKPLAAQRRRSVSTIIRFAVFAVKIKLAIPGRGFPIAEISALSRELLARVRLRVYATRVCSLFHSPIFPNEQLLILYVTINEAKSRTPVTSTSPSDILEHCMLNVTLRKISRVCVTRIFR